MATDLENAAREWAEALAQLPNDKARASLIKLLSAGFLAGARWERLQWTEMIKELMTDD